VSLFPLNRPSPAKPEATRRIKQWVEALGLLGRDGVVHVAELRCHEPGCPDFETVITLMFSAPGDDRTIKILKPLLEVTQEDVGEGIRKALAGGSAGHCPEC
jgi:hypothetical protein